MVLLDELRVELVGYRPQLKELGDVLQVAHAQSELDDLRIQVTYDGFWDDAEKSQKVMQKIRRLENTVDKFRHLNQKLEDTIALIDLCIEEDDDSSSEEILQDVESFKEELEAEKLSTLLTGEYDGSNAILTFHAGAGGTEAQDWAQMLYRMYNRWAERHDFKISLLDYLDGDEAGLKSASMLVEGQNAYGFLKSEAGVHRLVRVSPFDASGRRHTSFAALEVMPELDDSMEVDKDRVDKVSMCFTLPHTAGSLAHVLTILSFYGMNLTRIQSLPIPGREWQYFFYVDIKFNDYQRYTQAIAAVRPLMEDLDILGEYVAAI